MYMIRGFELIKQRKSRFQQEKSLAHWTHGNVDYHSHTKNKYSTYLDMHRLALLTAEHLITVGTF